MRLTLEEIFDEFADLDRQDQSLYLLELGELDTCQLRMRCELSDVALRRADKS